MSNRLPAVTPEQLEALTAEQSIVGVYRASRQIRKRWLYRFRIVELVVGGTVAGTAACSDASGATLGLMAREWLGLGFNFAVAILGFLLAGYTIFATLTGADFARVLVVHEYPGTKLSYLKYSTVQFMEVFISYLIFLAVYLGVAFFGWKGGALTMLCGAAHRAFGVDAWRIGAVIALAVVSGLLTHLLMTLQSFVYNVYSSVMAMARLRLMSDDDDIPG